MLDWVFVDRVSLQAVVVLGTLGRFHGGDRRLSPAPSMSREAAWSQGRQPRAGSRGRLYEALSHSRGSTPERPGSGYGLDDDDDYDDPMRLSYSSAASVRSSARRKLGDALGASRRLDDALGSSVSVSQACSPVSDRAAAPHPPPAAS